MRRSPRILTACLAVAFASLVVSAQPATTAPAAADGPTVTRLMGVVNGALEKVQLSDEQQAQLKQIIDTAKGEINALETPDDGDRRAARQQQATIIRKLRTSMEGVMTPEQKDAFRAGLNEQRQREGLATRPASRPTTRPE